MPSCGKQRSSDEYLRARTVGRLPCVKGAVGRRLTEGSAKAFLLNRVLSKHPALSIPPSRLRRATSLYAREASSGGGVPLIRPGLRPVHLPRRGRRPTGGGFIYEGKKWASDGSRWPKKRYGMITWRKQRRWHRRCGQRPQSRQRRCRPDGWRRGRLR